MLWKFSSSEGPPELSDCISKHWNALARGDSNGALEYVLPECRGTWRQPRICSWLLEDSRPVGADRFDVLVRVLMLTPLGYSVWRFRESWQRAADSWKVAKPDLRESLESTGWEAEL